MRRRFLYSSSKYCEHQAAQGSGHWGCSMEQVSHALPTALASDQIRDSFSAQTLSSSNTPTRKKILRGYFNRSPKHIGVREVRNINNTCQWAFNTRMHSQKRSPVLLNQYFHCPRSWKIPRTFYLLLSTSLVLFNLDFEAWGISHRGISMCISQTQPKVCRISQWA